MRNCPPPNYRKDEASKTGLGGKKQEPSFKSKKPPKAKQQPPTTHSKPALSI